MVAPARGASSDVRRAWRRAKSAASSARLRRTWAVVLVVVGGLRSGSGDVHVRATAPCTSGGWLDDARGVTGFAQGARLERRDARRRHVRAARTSSTTRGVRRRAHHHPRSGRPRTTAKLLDYRRHGWGTFQEAAGYKYEGDWHDDERHGYGREVRENATSTRASSRRPRRLDTRGRTPPCGANEYATSSAASATGRASRSCCPLDEAERQRSRVSASLLVRREPRPRRRALGRPASPTSEGVAGIFRPRRRRDVVDESNDVLGASATERTPRGRAETGGGRACMYMRASVPRRQSRSDVNVLDGGPTSAERDRAPRGVWRRRARGVLTLEERCSTFVVERPERRCRQSNVRDSVLFRDAPPKEEFSNEDGPPTRRLRRRNRRGWNVSTRSRAARARD